MVFSLHLYTVNNRHLAGEIQTQTKSDFPSGLFQYVRPEVRLIRLPHWSSGYVNQIDPQLSSPSFHPGRPSPKESEDNYN